MNKFQYYRRLVSLFSAYKRKKTTLSYLPVRLWIEPTNHCNLQCVMCLNKELKKEDKGYMDFNLFKKIIDEASPFVFEVNLHHRGESLLHPDFFKMAGYAHEKNIITKCHTNGTLLDEAASHKLIETGLDQVSFSFDGYDKETYERIRVKGDFEKTVKNIARFLEIKKKFKSRKPYTILELINFPDSDIKTARTKKQNFLNNFKDLPLDRLVMKEMHNWAGEVAKNQESKHFSPCTFLWQALVVFWDGSVLPCPQDFFGYYVLGNVKDSSLAARDTLPISENQFFKGHVPISENRYMSLWNNEKMVDLREKMTRRDIGSFKTCSQCDRVWRKTFLGIPREYLWKFLFKKMT